jgi:hypothetical protein
VPRLYDVAEELGLSAEAVDAAGSFAASRAHRALDDYGNRPGYVPADEDESRAAVRPRHDNLGSEEELFERRVQYIADHGFRALGHVAIFDQHAARELGDRLLTFLRDSGKSYWPLSYASAGLPEWNGDWSNLAAQLRHAPSDTATVLATLLLPSHLPSPEGGNNLGPDFDDWEVPPRSSSRELTAYGIDLELLRTLILGHDPSDPRLTVSTISTPALVRAFFRSVENVLTEASLDRYHWKLGLSVIQPTDPEVLLAIRVCLRSPRLGASLRDLPSDLPMARALVRLVEELDA